MRNDIGSYGQAKLQGLSDDEELWLLTNAYRPNSTHVFPQKERSGPFSTPGWYSFPGSVIPRLRKVATVDTVFFC